MIEEMYSIKKVGWKAECCQCDVFVMGSLKSTVGTHIRDHIRKDHLGLTPRILPGNLDSAEKRDQRWVEENQSKDWTVRPIRRHLLLPNCWCDAHLFGGDGIALI